MLLLNEPKAATELTLLNFLLNRHNGIFTIILIIKIQTGLVK